MRTHETAPDGAGDPFRAWDGAYVLGALSPQDRRLFEEHLRACDDCRQAVADLAGMPGLLRSLPPEDAAGLLDEPARDAEVVDLATVARRAGRQQRHRLAGLTAAAAGLLVVGGTAGALLVPGAPTRSPGAAATALSLQPVGASAVTADLTLEPKAWGTRVDWSCTYPAGAWPDGDGPTYELVLVADDGTETVVATWVARDTGAEGLGASSAVPASRIDAVQIRLAGAPDALAAAEV